jgi:hypothetical protein
MARHLSESMDDELGDLTRPKQQHCSTRSPKVSFLAWGRYDDEAKPRCCSSVRWTNLPTPSCHRLLLHARPDPRSAYTFRPHDKQQPRCRRPSRHYYHLFALTRALLNCSLGSRLSRTTPGPPRTPVYRPPCRKCSGVSRMSPRDTHPSRSKSEMVSTPSSPALLLSLY